jgi:hypothetical protein
MYFEEKQNIKFRSLNEVKKNYVMFDLLLIDI